MNDEWTPERNWLDQYDEKQKTKTQAINYARSSVSNLYRFGDGWKYDSFDQSVDAWREHNPLDYYMARISRAQTLIDKAHEYLEIESPQYEGGNWTDYVNAY